MQLKFLTLGFISVAVFSNVVYASVATVHDTDVDIHDVLTNILNHLNAKNALKNANVDAVSHIASEGGDVHRRSTLTRRAGEPDEEEADEEEADEEEADEEEADEEEADENEADEEEADENEPNEAGALKVYRRDIDTSELPINYESLCEDGDYTEITEEVCNALGISVLN